jgi:hypothetical protein
MDCGEKNPIVKKPRVGHPGEKAHPCENQNRKGGPPARFFIRRLRGHLRSGNPAAALRRTKIIPAGVPPSDRWSKRAKPERDKRQ